MSANANATEFVPRSTEEGHARDNRNRGLGGRGRGRGRERPNGTEKSSSRTGPQVARTADDDRTESKSTVAPSSAPAEDADEEEDCFICAEPIHFSAITACNHRTCHICALRLRALYKNYTCAYCKTESKDILFTLPSTKHFTDYESKDIACKDDKLGISFEQVIIMEETMILLRFNCPVGTCDVAANGWPDLKLHIKQAHNQLLCDLCVKNKKIFTHEHDLFTQKGLTQHYKFGDRNAADDNGFKGHPECGFCRKAFYDDDELYKHCRDKHERCHVCDQLDNGPGRAQYFQDYKQLDQHFRRDHFVCPEPSCLEQKFVVFGSELDLKAHQLEAHPHGLSGQALRDARKVNTSFAGYEGPANARGNRGGRRPEISFQSAGSGSSAPLSREQQALQRQFEYQQSRAQMTGFGYALSEPDPPPPPQPAMQVPKPSPAVQREPLVEAFPALGGGKAGSTSAKPSKPQTSKGQRPHSARQTSQQTPDVPADEMNKHQALLERVKMITSYDDDKVALFKTNIAQYRSTNITAPELIENLWSLFGASAEILGGIVTSSADVLDSETKKQDLLTGWNDWKVKNKVDKPIFSSTLTSATGGGQRILNIKNRASRTAAQTSSVWNQASTATAKDPIANTASKLRSLQVSGRSSNSTYTPAWSASVANSRSGSGTSTPVSRNQPAAAPMDFPSLPTGSRNRANTSQYFQKSNGWDNTDQTRTGVIGPEDYENGAFDKKGKKKVKKQLLFSQGLQRG